MTYSKKIDEYKYAVLKLLDLKNGTGSIEQLVGLIKPERLDSLIAEKLI